MGKSSDKNVYRLPKHSLAKIKCYRTYLDIYLSILAYSPFNTIYLIDLFAGEGRDVDGKACSSLAAIEAIKKHYDTATKKCNHIVVFLNDIGKSVIEKDIQKIKRVENFVGEISLPKNVEITYLSKKFEELLPEIITKLNQLDSSERVVCFIDPFGYKYSKPDSLKDLMANGKTEILLFIPICFMHRFAAKAIKDESYQEGKHIEEFIDKLFNDNVPDIQNQVRFIKSIQTQFKSYLNIPYVDVMYIEKEKGQFFALFFFSNSKRGFQKMLEAKWTIDETNGYGFTVNKSSLAPSLFDNIDHDDYTYLLYNEMTARKEMNNQQVFDFGLDNNHLPKHSNKVIQELKKAGKLKVITETGVNALGNYLEDGHNKKVFFIPIK